MVVASDQSSPLFIRLRSATTGQWIAPPELRKRLIADAAERGTNLTEAATIILARRYDVPYEPHGRRTTPALKQDVLNLRIPVELAHAIGVAAASARPRKRSDQQEALATLCAHFGLRMPAKIRYSRPSRRRAA